VTLDTAPAKASVAMAAPVYARDELLYYRVSDGILSLRYIESQTEASAYRLLACSSTESTPMLVNIVSSMVVQTLNRPINQNIGTYFICSHNNNNSASACGDSTL